MKKREPDIRRKARIGVTYEALEMILARYVEKWPEDAVITKLDDKPSRDLVDIIVLTETPMPVSFEDHDEPHSLDVLSSPDVERKEPSPTKKVMYVSKSND